MPHDTRVKRSDGVSGQHGKRWAIVTALARSRSWLVARLRPMQDAMPFSRLAFDKAGVWLTRERVEHSSRAARSLIGDAACAGVPREVFVEAIAGNDPALARAIARLLETGAAFRHRRAFGGRCHEVSGEPDGAACLLTFRDISADVEALNAARKAQAATMAEVEGLRAALDAAPQPVWLRGPDGETRWRNVAASGARRPGDAPVTRIDLAADAGAIEMGAPVATGGPEATLRGFVRTVMETFAHLRVALAIFDSERRLTLFNPALAEMFGTDARWLAGRPTLRETLDRLREARQLPEQADYPAWRAALFTLFDDVARASYDDIWELPDGRSVHVVGRPHPLGGIAFVFEDVTEAIALQRWRSTAVEVRRATLDLLGDGVAVFGADGQMRIANPAFNVLWGLDQRGIDAPKHVADLAAACGAQCADTAVWDRIRSAVAGGGGRSPWNGRTHLGDGRVLAARIAPMADGSTLAVFSDITDSERVKSALRDRAAALEAAETMRTALVDQFSHRLRTPLNAIFGFSQFLGEGRAGPVTPLQRSYFDNIQSASTLLLEAIENLADLASMQAVEADPTLSDVPVAPALRGALGLLERRLADRGARLSLGDIAEEAVARGDPSRIRQLIFSLLADAVGRSRDGDRLTAGVALRGGQLEVWCERPHDPATGGAGVPALLAHRAAELRGGAVFIETPAEGLIRSVCRLPAVTQTLEASRGDAATR